MPKYFGGGGSGGGGVTSFNTRTGAVVPALNDYATSLVQNDSGVFGVTTLSAALQAIDTRVPTIGANGTVLRVAAGASGWALLTGANISSAAALAVTSGAFSSFVGIGAANQALTGSLRLSYGSTVVGRDSTNASDISLMTWGVFSANTLFSNAMTINSFAYGSATGGALTSTSILITPSIAVGATPASAAAGFRLGHAQAAIGRNSGNTANVDLWDWGLTTANVFTIGGATSRIRCNATNGLAFYSATPIAQPTAVGALTDSTTGAPSTTLVDVGVAFSQANINNNFSSVLTKLNAINTRLSQAAGGIGLTA